MPSSFPCCFTVRRQSSWIGPWPGHCTDWCTWCVVMYTAVAAFVKAIRTVTSPISYSSTCKFDLSVVIFFTTQINKTKIAQNCRKVKYFAFACLQVCLYRAADRAVFVLWYVGLVSAESRHFNPLDAELNPICHLLALLGDHHILHVSRMRVNPKHVFFTGVTRV
jgi:hypothetical protein